MKPLSFRGYTDAQWREIADAAGAVCPDLVEDETFRLRIVRATTRDYLGGPKRRLSLGRERQEELTRIIEALRTLEREVLDHLGWALAETVVDLPESLAVAKLEEMLHDPALGASAIRTKGIPEEWDKIGAAYALARPLLREAELEAMQRLEWEQRLLARDEEAITCTSGAKKHYQSRLFDAVAALWEEFGGVVYGSREYQRFFHAVVGPIFHSQYGKDNGLNDWPDVHYTERNEVFRKHARAWRKKRATPAQRGRPRKKGAN